MSSSTLSEIPSRSHGKAKAKDRPPKVQKVNPSQSSKLRGLEKDSPQVRVSKTLSWLLRHGAQNEGLHIRSDGYIRVADVLNHIKIKATGLDLEGLRDIVCADEKQRYDLLLENVEGVKCDTTSSDQVDTSGATSSLVKSPLPDDGIWWIKARQGHSIKSVQLSLVPIHDVKDIPTGMAIHGTNRQAWATISKEGLCKMTRNHIHLAQDVAGKGVVSGMRTTSSILIYIDVEKALGAGINFWLSDNGVVLTEGDERGRLPRRYFKSVVDVKAGDLHGWEEE